MSEIIYSYGLFWTADNIFWGAGRQPGRLLGVPSDSRTSAPVDFRTQAGIYVLYLGHEMVYVGQTGSGNVQLLARLKQHRRDQLAERWDAFSWFGLRRVLASGHLSSSKLRAGSTLKKMLNHMEAMLIAAAEPQLNRQGGRFGDKAAHYLQVRDERLGPTDSQMIRELWDRF